MAEQSQPAPTPAERPLWKLDRGEQRVLLITFVGGVASIVTAACVIGGAIAADRALARVQHGHINWVTEATDTGILLVIGVGTLFLTRRRHRTEGMDWTSVFGAVVYGLLLAFSLLIWIGLAAGIH